MGLDYDLHHQKIMHLDLTKFVMVKTGTPVKEVVDTMRSKNRNCALVSQDDELIGIFTDRDILKKIVTNPNTWDKAIDEVMSPSPITVNDTDPAEAAITLMNKKRIRNTPVLNKNKKVIGNLTHYSLIKFVADHFPESIYNLPPNPDRVSRKRGGA